MGLDLGTISASVGLNTSPLAAGVLKAKGMMSGLDASMAKGGLKSTEAGLAGMANGFKAVGAAGVPVVGVFGNAEKGAKSLATQLKSVAGFGGPAAGAMNTVGSSIGTLGTIGIAAAGVAALAGGFYACAKAAEEESKVNAQTNAVIKSTGGVANVTAGHVDKLGVKLANISGTSHDVIKAAENIMLTFRLVANQTGKNNDIFDQSIIATENMSVALGKDMKDSAIKVGKALQDPVKGLTALRRYGVMFTDQQVAQAKAMVQNNDLMGAQKMILAELATEFGGSAAAAGTTLSGSLNILKDNVDQLMEAFGKSTLPIVISGFRDLTTVAKGLTAIKVPEIVSWMNKASQWLNPVTSLFKIITTGPSGLQKAWYAIFGQPAKPKVDSTEAMAEFDKLEAAKQGLSGIETVSLNVDMAQVTAAKTAAHQGWNEPAIILGPDVDMSLVTAAKTAAHQGWNDPAIILAPQVDMSNVSAAQVSAHQGWDTTMHVTTVVGPGSGYGPIDWWLGQVDNKINNLSPTMSITMGTGGGGAPTANAMTDLANATALANRTFGNFISDMNAKPLNEVNEAIMRLTASNSSSLADWWKLRGAYDATTASLAKYEQQVTTAEKAVTTLEGKIEKANAARERPSMVLDKKSLELQLAIMKAQGAGTSALYAKSTKLQLEIMKAEDAHNYALAAKLTLEKEALDRKKEELDLTTSIAISGKTLAKEALDRKKEELDLTTQIADKTKELTDTKDFAGMTTKQIDALIATWTKALAGKVKDVAALKVTYDQVQASVDTFKKIIDDLSAYFTSQSPPPSYDVGTSYVPKTGMALIHEGEMIIPSNLNPVNLGSGPAIQVNSYTTLDGKVLTKTVSRYQGGQANSRAMSGGHY